MWYHTHRNMCRKNMSVWYHKNTLMRYHWNTSMQYHRNTSTWYYRTGSYCITGTLWCVMTGKLMWHYRNTFTGYHKTLWCGITGTRSRDIARTLWCGITQTLTSCGIEGTAVQNIPTLTRSRRGSGILPRLTTFPRL